MITQPVLDAMVGRDLEVRRPGVDHYLLTDGAAELPADGDVMAGLYRLGEEGDPAVARTIGDVAQFCARWTGCSISHTGCQWRFLPESFGPWTRVWSQFRRWSRKGTWARALTVLHEAVREAGGRAGATPSMVVIDTHLARGASNGGLTFQDRGGA